MTLGESARKAREEAGLSLSKLSNLSGIPLTTICNLEKDMHNPSIIAVEALAMALNITIEEYIGSEIDCVHVVRCKNCAVPHNENTGCPKLLGLVTPPYFYCPYGERRTDGT